MALLLDDLLDVSRITRGKLELRQEAVALASDRRTALETAAAAARRAAADDSTSACRRAGIAQCGSAARRAGARQPARRTPRSTRSHGGRVVLAAEVEDNRVAIRVRDWGIGIDPESLPRIFEMFSQAKSSLDRAEGGLGIGLALVKGIVEIARR